MSWRKIGWNLIVWSASKLNKGSHYKGNSLWVLLEKHVTHPIGSIILQVVNNTDANLAKQDTMCMNVTTISGFGTSRVGAHSPSAPVEGLLRWLLRVGNTKYVLSSSFTTIFRLKCTTIILKWSTVTYTGNSSFINIYQINQTYFIIMECLDYKPFKNIGPQLLNKYLRESSGVFENRVLS